MMRRRLLSPQMISMARKHIGLINVRSSPTIAMATTTLHNNNTQLANKQTNHQQQQQQNSSAANATHTNNHVNNQQTKNNNSSTAAAAAGQHQQQSIFNMTEEELKQNIPKFSNQDSEKLEKMLQDILSGKQQTSSSSQSSSQSSSSDYRPIMIINVVLLALFVTSLLMRYRDELMHDMTKELLVDTRDELGNELLRLKQSRLDLIESLLNSSDAALCNAKCQKFVQEWRERMEQEDQSAVNQIVADSLAHLNKKPSKMSILESSRNAPTTTTTAAATTATSATSTEAPQPSNKSSRMI